MSVDKLLRSVCMNALLVLLLTLFCFPVGVFGLGNGENLSGNEFRTVEYDSSAAYGMDISVDGKPLSSSVIHVGQSVQMHVTGLTEQSNYVFNYVWSYNGNWDFWSSTFLETGDYTPLSMSEFTPLRAGTYILYVDIVTPDGTYSVSDSIAVYEDWSVAGVNIDAPSAHIGETVSVTSNLTGPDAAYARFNYVWCYEGGWDDWSSTLKETGDYTSDSSWSFTPSKAGDYAIYVDAVRTNGAIESYTLHLSVQEDWNYIGLNVGAASIELGEKVDLFPEIIGPDAAYARFNYVWCYEGGWDDWSSTLKETGDYTSDSSWTFTPTKAGNYVLYVDAIKTDGTLETKSCALSVSAEWSAASLSVSVYEDDHANTVLYGQELQISVVFSEDSNLTGMQYNFGWQFGDGWGDWFSLEKDSEVSSDNSFSFIPDRAGTYTVFADAIGTDGRRETVSTKIHVIFPFSISGAVAEQRNLLIGQEACFAPIYTGDLSTAQLNYVWSYNGSWSDGNWSSTLVETGNYTNDASFIFTPPKYGEYDLYLDVVYPDGSTETFSTSVSVSSGWSTSGITIDKETPQYVNTELIISANVMGERSSNVLYNYVVQRNGNEWSSTLMDTGDYTEEPVWSFIPEKSGDYVFYIDVVDKNTGQQVTINRSFRINKTWHLERLDLSYDSPMRPYSNVTMKPVISGDTTGLRFNYVWQGDNWYVWDSNLKHGDYSNQSSTTVTISNGGTYGFYIDVIDQNGEIEHAEVTGIRARYAYDIINRIEGTIARQSSLDGTYVENKVLEAGGYLCNNRRGYWCGALVWYGFYENGFLDLWGSSHMQVDPEYLANEFRAMGRYYNGTAGIQRGDIIFFYWTPWRGSQYITHVAYVTGVSGSTVTVAEGNMGYRSIYHTYSLWSSNIRGFARPAY